MGQPFRSACLVLAISSAPITADAAASGSPAGGAFGGVVAGALIGGPIGALVGGMAGAAIGSGLHEEEPGLVKRSVVRPGLPSPHTGESIGVGGRIARDVKLYRIPSEVGAPAWYRYTVVNGRTVFVDGRTRQIVRVFE